MTLHTIIDNTSVLHRSTGKRAEVADRMTGLALVTTGRPSRRRGDVIGRFLHRRHALVRSAGVTAGTATDNAGVLHRCSGERSEYAGRMTGFARHAGRNMGRAGPLGDRLHPYRKSLAVMTGRTTAHDTEMVHLGKGYAVPGRMAKRAGLCCRQVIGRHGSACCTCE